MSETKNNLVCISGVRGYEEDGVAYLHIEDSARGLGFEKTENKNGVEYNSIRWAIVEGYLQDFGFRQEAVENGKPHDYYIPENIFYRLCMKAKNEVAEAFQAKVADEIIPSIRKTGSYGVTQRSRKDQLYLSIIHSESEEERADALKELAEINKQEVKALTAERDEAVRTKALIGSTREATAMATASAKARECEKLREQIGDSTTYKRATAIPWLSEYFDTRNTGLYNSLAAQLKKIEAAMSPEFAHKDTEDSRYGSVKAYHVAVIERLHEIVREKLPVDKKFMAKYRKDVSPKTKNA